MPALFGNMQSFDARLCGTQALVDLCVVLLALRVRCNARHLAPIVLDKELGKEIGPSLVQAWPRRCFRVGVGCCLQECLALFRY
ncbi:hypothetical protein BC827DRAFT_1199250 [Russula dissimulans]|nr:hypothetical protein BC827DRAFT_1199250 [Russula dissimulans]